MLAKRIFCFVAGLEESDGFCLESARVDSQVYFILEVKDIGYVGLSIEKSTSKMTFAWWPSIDPRSDAMIRTPKVTVVSYYLPVKGGARNPEIVVREGLCLTPAAGRMLNLLGICAEAQ